MPVPLGATQEPDPDCSQATSGLPVASIPTKRVDVTVPGNVEVKVVVFVTIC